MGEAVGCYAPSISLPLLELFNLLKVKDCTLKRFLTDKGNS